MKNFFDLFLTIILVALIWLFNSFICLAENSDSAIVNQLLEGSIDFHLHSAPDITPRSIDDFDLAQMGAKVKMKALVLKNHVTNTADRAVLANKIVSGIDLYGGIVLNKSVGGINPRAVEVMYLLGHGKGKVVWLPTIDADYHHQVFHKSGMGLRISQAGKLLPDTKRVLELIKQYNLVLGTGHISPDEIKLVVKEAKKLEINHILVTHAMADVPGLSLQEMQEIAHEGAFLELTYVNDLMGQDSPIEAHHQWHRVSIPEMAEAIKLIGAEYFVLSTDLGREFDPLPVDGYKQFILELLKAGISPSDIKLMSHDNPSQLLGLN